VSTNPLSPESFIESLGAELGDLAVRSWEAWTIRSLELSSDNKAVLLQVRHPRVPDGTVIEYAVEPPLDLEQAQFCLMAVEPLLDSENDPMGEAQGSPPRIVL
jgi:hypothetical protein